MSVCCTVCTFPSLCHLLRAQGSSRPKDSPDLGSLCLQRSAIAEIKRVASTPITFSTCVPPDIVDLHRVSGRCGILGFHQIRSTVCEQFIVPFEKSLSPITEYPLDLELQSGSGALGADSENQKFHQLPRKRLCTTYHDNGELVRSGQLHRQS